MRATHLLPRILAAAACTAAVAASPLAFAPTPALGARGAHGACVGPRGGRAAALGLRMQEGPVEPRRKASEVDWKGLQQMGSDWVRQGPVEDTQQTRIEDLPAPRWYIVQCNPGLEDTVGTTLLAKRANSKWLQTTIKEVLVPCTNITKLGMGGQRVIKAEKLMPGYVLVNMHMDKDTWFTVKNSNHVQNFVGHDRARKNAAGGIAGGRGHVVPTPLTRAEEKRIFDKITAAQNAAAASALDAGDCIRVLEGPFQGNTGKIIEADHKHMRFKVRLDLFKKETPTEFAGHEIEYIKEDDEEVPPTANLDMRTEEDVKSELYAALEAQNQVSPFKHEDDTL